VAEASIAITLVAEDLSSASTISFNVPREVAEEISKSLEGYPSESAIWDNEALHKASQFVEDETVALWAGDGHA